MIQKVYIHWSKAWYANPTFATCSDKVTFGLASSPLNQPVMISPGVQMCWYKLGKSLTPCLECYGDAFATLWQCQHDILEALSNSALKEIMPEQFCLLLQQLGYTDITPHTYEDSYPPKRRYENNGQHAEDDTQ